MGHLVESNNTIFGSNGFQRKATLKTDLKWQTQELHVTIHTLNMEMCASVKDGKVYFQQKQQEANFEKIIDLQYDKHFFIYSGALIVPFIWLRGFDFDNYEKVTYQMLPMGYAEVKQLPDDASGQDLRHFSLLMNLQNFTDIVRIQTDRLGKVLLYQSETNQITIKLQPK